MMVPCLQGWHVTTTMWTRSFVLLSAGVVGMTLVWAQGQAPVPAGQPQGQAPVQPPQQPQPQGDQQAPAADAPGRAARLGLVTGNVTLQPGSIEDWIPAPQNRPLTTGDRLWTDTGGRAEVNVGSMVFRLNSRTNFTIINLDDRVAQVQVSSGTVNVRVRKIGDDESVEIDTPQAALSILRPGDYRVDVNEQGDTSFVTVRGGEIEATAGQAFPIHPREQVRIAAEEGGTPTFDRREAQPADQFDNFCMDRDRNEDLSQSARYVSRDIPGYSDLDAAGTWQTTPQYGPVWTPTAVPVGWAPYHTGHWAWIAPWGWTWVDDMPWGYAPFHYGRWVFYGGNWGWVPGPMPQAGIAVVRPMYAPALVAWVGGPSFGVSVGIGAGAVGWFPLGPREVFVPSYGYSAAYMERVNVSNTVIVNRTVFNNVNVTNVNYVNRGVTGAVVAVPSATMISGRPVAGAGVVVRPQMMAGAQVTAAAGVAPERGAVVGGRAASNFAPPANVTARSVVTRNPPPPPPVAFEHQQAAIAGNGGRPLNQQTMTQIRAMSPPPAQRPMYRPVPGGNQSVPPPVNRPFTPQNTPQNTPPRNTPPVTQRNPRVTPPPQPNPAIRPDVTAARPTPAPAPVNHPAPPPPHNQQKQPVKPKPRLDEKEKK